MSTIYNGQAPNVSATSGARRRVAIVSSTNATPINIQATAHGFNTGDSVEIEGHLVNTNANGLWVISKVDANNYTLNGSTGNGVGVNTGYAIDYELLPAVTIPSNGDLADMSVLGAAIENVKDPIPFLYRAAGPYRVYGQYSAIVNPSVYTAWSTDNPFSSATFTSLAAGTGFMGFPSPAPVLQVNDVLVVHYTMMAECESLSGPDHNVIFAPSISIEGLSGGAYLGIGFGQLYALARNAAGGGALFTPVSIAFSYGVGGVVAGGSTFDLGLMAKTDAGSTGDTVSILMWGPASVQIVHLRAN